MAAATSTKGESETFGWDEWSDKHRWRITASLIGPIAWLIFTLLYVGFWAPGFTILQSVVIVLVSILILAGVMGGIWTWWAPTRHTPAR